MAIGHCTHRSCRSSISSSPLNHTNPPPNSPAQRPFKPLASTTQHLSKITSEWSSSLQLLAKRRLSLLDPSAIIIERDRESISTRLLVHPTQCHPTEEGCRPFQDHVPVLQSQSPFRCQESFDCSKSRDSKHMQRLIRPDLATLLRTKDVT